MGEVGIGLAAGIVGGTACLGFLLCFISYSWGRDAERQAWLKLIAEKQQKAQEALTAPPPADPLSEL